MASSEVVPEDSPARSPDGGGTDATGVALVDGNPTTRRAAMAYATTNPYTGEVVATFPTATSEQVEVAITRADHAYGSWRSTTAEHRGDILQRAADLLRGD
ncbi:MAG: aldehyde dehydrogenase family protein, partial [Propionibacterium sp.]|nr:aldehyde dehydrogenase family protein [Propionibacterium sp.]